VLAFELNFSRRLFKMKSLIILDPRGTNGVPCNREITVFQDGSGFDSLGKYQLTNDELLQWYNGSSLKTNASGEIVKLFSDAVRKLAE